MFGLSNKGLSDKGQVKPSSIRHVVRSFKQRSNLAVSDMLEVFQTKVKPSSIRHVGRSFKQRSNLAVSDMLGGLSIKGQT